MKKGVGSESTIIIGSSKSVLIYALHCLEYVLGLARFRVFVPHYIIIIKVKCAIQLQKYIFFEITVKGLINKYPKYIYIH